MPTTLERHAPLRSEAVKRAFDIVCSIFGLILLSPVMAVCALCVWLDAPGPVFYRGLRAGRDGVPFRQYKFRTMVANAEKLGGIETAADDPRITRVGAFLRECKLDEFPQLVNVLKGEMSIVGPRPEAVDEVKLYTIRERQLLRVRPGVTDWASVKFRWEQELLRGTANPRQTYYQTVRPEKIRLGLEYVESHSLFTDLKIIFATVQALFTPFRGVPDDATSAAQSAMESYEQKL
jgi:lipopolysaccharide/colanic/teichoic acid biosynthesis glycosyltransferase